MERSMRLVSAAFVLVLLLVATEMGTMGVEARGPKLIKPVKDSGAKKRTCESPSNKFKGMCFFTSNCATTCKTEGFNGGQCRGFRRRCLCSKQC